MTLLLAAPAAGAGAVRDVVIDEPSAGAARISASAATERYPVNDGSAATIAIAVSAACQVSCNAVEPQRIADFVGTLIHGPEIELLTIQLDTPFQMEFDCGYGAQACYFPSENKVVIGGSDTSAYDGVSREFILAHEYGHHVANHRDSPAPFPAAIDWGPPRWASLERVCQARRRGVLFPGDEGLHYRENPGEAFAEAFARYRFPDSAPRWKWAEFLRPDAASFRAIREDTLNPWFGRTSFRLDGRAPSRHRGGAVEALRTPLDGTVSLRPNDQLRRRYQLTLLSATGQLLSTSRHGLSMRRQLNFTVCGQSRLRLLLESTRRATAPFQLLVQRP
ncbi:MAG TPA: hypothetical protein VFT10_03740 [Solirubrobacterales bacterium]|nr:hypothetical protein [Solirubrobacterales bacterium]